jgi:hypothetical protein
LKEKTDKPTGDKPHAAEQGPPGRPNRPAAVAFTLLLLLATLGALYIAVKPRSGLKVDVVLGKEFVEPSGIVFHPTRKTLFVIGDEGDIGEMTPEGKVLRRGTVGRLNPEAITADPRTGLLYVALEGKNRILEVDPTDLEVIRHFDIEEHWGTVRLLPPFGEGLEGIACVPVSGKPSRFFITNRGPAARGAQAEEEFSFLAELSLPLDAPRDADLLRATFVNAFPCEVSDLSGLTWDFNSRQLIAVSDNQNCLVELGLQGNVQRRIALPGHRQEGAAFDEVGFLYVAQDSGGVLKLRMTGAPE